MFFNHDLPNWLQLSVTAIIHIVYVPPHNLIGYTFHVIILYVSVLNIMNRYFGGIKLGTGGLVRAYGGVASECLKDAPTCLVKPKVINVQFFGIFFILVACYMSGIVFKCCVFTFQARVGMEVPFDLLGTVYHQVILIILL